jgi:signal transduction histidine kinase
LLLTSLSARLLVLTVFFIMLGEVLIFVPSVARFRMTWFDNRIAAGELAALALEASPTGQLDHALVGRLLARVGAHAVVVHRANGMVLMLDRPMPAKPDLKIDLTRATMWGAIRGSLMAVWRNDNRVLNLVGLSPVGGGETVELVLDEAPLRRQMWLFGVRVLELSIVLSLLTAALVYLSLQWLLVRPMRRITASMMAFREDPEDPARMMMPSRRRDEIGLAARELATLQQTVRRALSQRARLAALGTAVAKINHDLRNILATARLVTDGLTTSAAPEVRRILPRLIDAIDRAVALCTRTLDFSRAEAAPLAPSRFALAPLIEEVGAGIAPAEGFAVDSAVPADFAVEADRDQLYRVLANLARNALEAGAHRLLVSAMREVEAIVIDVCDDGPGLPGKARDNLFRPFFGSARPGGSGLGLAIARELVRTHGGDLSLVATGAAGTRFRITLPAPAARAAPVNREKVSST